MYQAIWRFRILPENKQKFESAYGSDGPWCALFKKSLGYIGTTLSELEKPYTYQTIDTWKSLEDFEAFKEKHQDEYQKLDLACANLTETEERV